MKYTCIDTHTHLNLPAFAADREEVLARTLADQVAHINIGTTEKTSAFAVEIADKNEGSWAIIGLHPIQAAPGSEDEDEDDRGGTPAPTGCEAFNSDFYRTLAKSSKVVGIGESVYEDVYQTLKQYSKVPGNIHFYAGTLPEAEKFFELGFTVSFTGVITFAKMYEELVRVIPLTNLHAETDSPYVSPVPYRGQRCEPRYVAEVVKKIAEIKQLPLEEVQEQLLKNVK